MTTTKVWDCAGATVLAAFAALLGAWLCAYFVWATWVNATEFDSPVGVIVSAVGAVSIPGTALIAWRTGREHAAAATIRRVALALLVVAIGWAILLVLASAGAA